MSEFIHLRHKPYTQPTTPNELVLAIPPLRSFVLDLLTPMRLLPEMAEHQLQVSIEEGLVVALDTRLLGQVISNLVLNATQAMDKPGIIAIVAVQAVDHVVIDVSDTGRGIPAEQRQGIFEPFFTTKARGSGLGLAIARKNVEAHGGTLQLEEQEGPGSWSRSARDALRMRL